MAQSPVIDRYQVRRGLGRGAMGSVYLAYDPKIGREVAVKVLQKDFAQNAKHRQRFEREARAIAALKHPNIVEIYDYGGSPDEHLFLVMEYIEGPNAGNFCREHGVFPESVLASVGMQLASALREAHAAGIIHRDLKPENVFLDRGRLVLADFGIAKAIDESNPFGAEAASPFTEVIGTPGFMAPEQLEQQPLDERTDIFAFGAMLYYLASKQLPFDADSPYDLLQQFRKTRPVPVHEIRPEMSEGMSRLIQDCIEVEPSARPDDIRQAHQRLRELLEKCGASEPRETLAEFCENPMEFRAVDRARVVNHLVSRLKIAVRDQDGIEADEIRARLGVLDPENEDAARITGLNQLVGARPSAHFPELDAIRGGTRRWTGLAIVAALIAAGVGLWMSGALGPLLATLGEAESSKNGSKPVAMIRVRANDRTQVFLSGRALGSTPDFPPAIVPAGPVALEFINDKKGRLQHKSRLAAGDEVVLVVDWKRKRVKIRKLGRPPSKKR